MPMFVSTATIRRGTAAGSAPNAGCMASSNGRARATPAPRKKVRRDNGAGVLEKEGRMRMILGGCSEQWCVLYWTLHRKSWAGWRLASGAAVAMLIGGIEARSDGGS